MIGFPQSGVNSELSYFYSKQESAELSATKEINDGKSTLQVSASYSSTVTITGERQSALTYAPTPAAPVEEVPDEAPSRTQAAENILKFIETRIKLDAAEGATAEELEARLKEGFEGFLKGYHEAYDQLAGTGLLSDEIEEAIEQTKADVVMGINALADEMGIESPTIAYYSGEGEKEGAPAEAEEPSVSQMSSNEQVVKTPQQSFSDFASDLVGANSGLSELLESTTLKYESVAKRDFSFDLKTRDGDKITITASASQEAKLGYGSVDYASPYANASVGAYQSEVNESSLFNVTVKGELDEGELAAINDLLSQVNDLSETFFAGNVQEAFEMALDIGFDTEEIAKFSLNLSQEVTSVVETTYAKVQDASKPDGEKGYVAEGKDYMQSFKESVQNGNQNSSMMRMKNFVAMLQDLAKQAQELGVERKELPNLVGDYASSRKDDVEAGEQIKSFTSKMLDAMES